MFSGLLEMEGLSSARYSSCCLLIELGSNGFSERAESQRLAYENLGAKFLRHLDAVALGVSGDDYRFLPRPDFESFFISLRSIYTVGHDHIE